VSTRLNPALPALGDFGLQPELVPVQQDTLSAEELPAGDPIPLGRDLALDPHNFDLVLDASGDVQYASEGDSFVQWARVTLGTQTAVEIIYPAEFGSRVYSLITSGLPPSQIPDEVASAIADSMLFHDRVDHVQDVKVTEPEEEGFVSQNTFCVYATIVLDDDAILSFEATTRG
jgi:hypothetical protein